MSVVVSTMDSRVCELVDACLMGMLVCVMRDTATCWRLRDCNNKVELAWLS